MIYGFRLVINIVVGRSKVGFTVVMTVGGRGISVENEVGAIHPPRE